MTSYVVSHAGRTFTPDGEIPKLTDAQIDQHNRMIEQAQLANWADQPDKFAAYVKGQRIQTWLGTTIGTITSSRPYRYGLVNMAAIRVQGSNGAEYHGRYGVDSGELVRLRRCKPAG